MASQVRVMPRVLNHNIYDDQFFHDYHYQQTFFSRRVRAVVGTSLRLVHGLVLIAFSSPSRGCPRC